LIRQAICIQNEGGSEALQNVPILVRLNDQRTAMNRLGANGLDMRFLDVNGMPLAHEIEAFDPTEAVVWVNVPLVQDGSNDNLIWLYTNRPAPILPDTEGVWASEHIGVWHMGVSPITDVTGHGLDATGTDTQALPGLIADGNAPTLVDGGTTPNLARIEVADDAQLDDVENGFTVSGWVKINAVTSFWTALVARPIVDTPADQIYLGYRDGRALFSVQTGGAMMAEDTQTLPLDTWVHLAGTWNGTTQHLFVDGVEVATAPRNVALTPQDTAVSIGANLNIDQWADHVDGTIDEVRLEKVVRSAAWMDFQYRSMTDGLLVFGTVETRP
jgi:hypothetical protein